MRLLLTRHAEPGEYPLRLKYVHNPEDVPYAILSHTWDQDELIYEDLVRMTGENKTGFAKVQGAIQQARDDGHDYIWIDSVCIDKSSSSELQEAINSMFSWYRKAVVCYVHLADFAESALGSDTYPNLAASRWFKRGWTLQELIAPKDLRFYNRDWSPLGDRADLLEPLCNITRVRCDVLINADKMQSTSIAQRMSWAARRETTRGEDRAYSLMGMFGVNMPMLYGEGAINAFLRLQEIIMRRSDDQSLFAWCDSEAADDHLHGLLADSPDVFDYDGVARITANRRGRPTEPYTMTNLGLRIGLHVLTPQLDNPDMVYVARLHCQREDPPQPVEVFLIRLNPRGNSYARIRCKDLPYGRLASDFFRKAAADYIYIRQFGPYPKARAVQ